MKPIFRATVLTAFLAAGAPAYAGDSAELVRLCGEQLNVPDEICDCIGKTADAELDADERTMVIAMITKDEETAARLRTTLPMESMVRSGMFMASTPGRCAQQMQ